MNPWSPGDLRLLWDQFADMSEENVVGIGRDLTPHYYAYLEQFR